MPSNGNIDFYRNNKFFKTVLLSYYMLTRSVDLKQALLDSKVPNFFDMLFEEYILYLAGEFINVDEPMTYDIVVPQVISSKSANVLSACAEFAKSGD